MGKHKQAQRTKNNARPSSSGRSAELLGSSINPFAGFSAVKDTTIPGFTGLSFSSASIDDSELNVDANFQLVLKKMNKKDSTTKLKALQEFTELVQESQPEAVKAILAFWPRLYAALAVDIEHRVREATHIAHSAVVLKVKRDIAPHLKQLAGPWFTSQYDTYAAAASAASQSFKDAFPANKLQEAIVFCQKEILSYIHDNIIVVTPQTVCNPKITSPEEAEAKYERLLIASLQGYTLYLTKLSADQLQAAEELNFAIISNPKFWKLSKTKVSLIRAAWFGCVVALFQNAPFFFNNEVQHVTSVVFCNLDESEPSVVRSTWDASLYIISNFEDWWKHVSVEKLVLPKLWKVLKEAGQGNAAIIYPNILPLISHLPVTYNSISLYNNFFENMRIGMKKKSALQSRSELGAIISSFIECFRYIILKNISDLELCQHLLSSHLKTIIEWSFIEETFTTKILYFEISSLLQYWGKNRNLPECSNYGNIIEIFWKDLEDTMKFSLTNQTQHCDKEFFLGIINKHVELLLCLKKPSTIKQRKHSVKFSIDEKVETEDTVKTSHSSETDNPIIEYLNNLVYRICVFYLKFVKENRRNEIISPLCLLIQNFESENLFNYLKNNICEAQDKIDNLIDLLKNIFLKFLQIESTCSESVVDMVFIIFKYLNDHDKQYTLDSIVKVTNENSLCWCVAKALSHPYCNDKIIQNWLSTTYITKLLINIATKMLTDEISTDKSLLLKQSLSQNINEDLYVNKEACQEIMLIFCNCLLNPSDYPYTIDVCASFAAQLSSTIYTEKTVLAYGDQLMLALFSLNCNTTYDPEILSKDTLWEVSTAWQDILVTLISANLTTEFENILQKFKTVLENEFIKNDNNLVIEKLSTVLIDLIKCVLQTDNKTSILNQIIVTLLTCPTVLQPIKKQILDISNCGQLISGNLSWTENCPLSENILELTWNNLIIVKYINWQHYTISVINALFTHESTLDEENENEEDAEAILEESTEIIDNFLIDAIQIYAYSKIIMNSYKTSKLQNDLVEIILKLKADLLNLLTKIVPSTVLQTIQLKIETKCLVTSYILFQDILEINNLRDIYIKLKKYEVNNLHLTQLFSKYISFDEVIENKDKIDKIIITRNLLHCDEIDVQIAEALNIVTKIRENNIKSLLYNRDVSDCNWSDLQFIIEIIRLLKSLIQQKPLLLSNIHWDFILISLTAWTESMNKSKYKYRQLQVIEFISSVCDLYIIFHEFIKNQALVEQLNQSCSKIVTEYCDIFAEDVHVSLICTWMYIAEKEIELKSTRMILLPALEIIGTVILHLEENYLIQIGSIKFPKWQTFVQLCGNLLKAPISVLQLWGYYGLKQATNSLIIIDEKSVTENELRTHGLLSSQLGHVLTTFQDVVQIMLMDLKLGEESCRVQPFTDSYTFTFGYLLLWDIFLSYSKKASNDLKYQYSDWLKSGDYLKNLLNNIFKLIPIEVLHCSEGKKNAVINLFMENSLFDLSDSPTSELLEHYVCWVYGCAVTHLPALVRQWWTETEARLAHTIEQVTATHVSPILIAHELRDVMERRRNAGDNMKVSVHPSSREVVATYTVDEARMELVITLPVNHPLGTVHVECSKQIGGTAQWRNWVMQLTVFLTHQNGRIWDGLSLWKSNLDKKFDGIEECYICFSVLHNTTYQLPKLSCQTCRKKFHSPCLYKWFSTSNKSTCPICRNLF